MLLPRESVERVINSPIHFSTGATKNEARDPGFLDLEDIYNTNLPAELVVLSACETWARKISGKAWWA